MADQLSVPKAPGGRHRRARDAVLVIALASIVLLLFEGRSIHHTGHEMKAGWERSFVLAVGTPSSWLAERTHLADVRDNVIAWVKGGNGDGGAATGGFATARTATTGADGAVVPPVGRDAFDPVALGQPAIPPAPLRDLIVTGDSMSMPLDSEVARALARAGAPVRTTRDARVGTSLSNTDILDWGAEAGRQVRKHAPQAVVFFLGANEGFPMTGADGAKVTCCSRDWAAAYAWRVRQMMNTYRQGGKARVYWLLLPMPRDPARQKISRVVNAAILVAAQPYRAQVRVLDMSAIFTPGGVYRDAMDVGGSKQIVRESDGVHLNATGSRLAAARVIDALRADFGPQAVPR